MNKLNIIINLGNIKSARDYQEKEIYDSCTYNKFASCISQIFNNLRLFHLKIHQKDTEVKHNLTITSLFFKYFIY